MLQEWYYKTNRCSIEEDGIMVEEYKRVIIEMLEEIDDEWILLQIRDCVKNLANKKGTA